MSDSVNEIFTSLLALFSIAKEYISPSLDKSWTSILISVVISYPLKSLLHYHKLDE